MDHGVPWWSGRSPQGLTPLSLWLMRQGIGSHWSRVRHPQGKVEHFHGELQRALTRLGMPRHYAQQWWTSSAGNTTTCGRTKRWGW